MNAGGKQYPEGHFKWKGMAVGMPFGIPIGLAIGGPAFLGVGVCAGMCLGLAAGSAVESKYRSDGRVRPMTEEERRRKRLGIVGGICVGVALLGIVVGMGLVV